MNAAGVGTGVGEGVGLGVGLAVGLALGEADPLAGATEAELAGVSEGPELGVPELEHAANHQAQDCDGGQSTMCGHRAVPSRSMAVQTGGADGFADEAAVRIRGGLAVD